MHQICVCVCVYHFQAMVFKKEVYLLQSIYRPVHWNTSGMTEPQMKGKGLTRWEKAASWREQIH